MQEKKKILIVEDENEYAHMVKLRLESEGYEVTIANDAHIGTQEIFKGDHELVVLDLMMPGDTGFSVVRRMRHFPGRTTTPVVILTGKVIDKQVKAMAKAYDVLAVISKPYNSEEFLNTIKSLLPL